MKTMLILIILFTFINLNAQVPASWDDIVETYIQLANNTLPERVAIFANHYGIHLLKTIDDDVNGHVKYFLLTSDGNKPDWFPVGGMILDDYGDFPNIVGNENIIYAVYRKDYTIQVKYSTNGGVDWYSRPQISFFNLNPTNCNGVDAAYTSEYGLHVVWSEKVSGNYESYFKRFDQFGVWRNTEPLTSESTLEIGGFPTVTTSYYNGQYRAHVTINAGNADLLGNNHGVNYIRDYDYTSFSSPLQIISNGESKIERLLVTEDGLIHSFYYRESVPPTTLYPQFKYRKKMITSSTWDLEKEVEHYLLYEEMHKIQIAKTNGNIGTDIVHAFWMDETGGLYERKKNSSAEEWTIPRFLVSTQSVSFEDAAVTSISNDLFAVWGFRTLNTKYHFRHYDDKSLAPTSLTITESPNGHPYLSWTGNLEPDLDHYNIYRLDSYGGGWQYLAQTTNTNYEDETLTYCHPVPPAQCPDIRNFSFRVTTVDNGSHESDPSNEVTARLVGGPPWKIVTDPNSTEPVDYLLEQNYPNPFNPTTTISYSIKENSPVQLRVFDMLGNEVASLVNEYKESGKYSATFNAADLPSGIYVYRIIVGNFIATKKLILLK